MVDCRTVPADILSGSFSEKLIYLPLGYQANDMPRDVAPCICTGEAAGRGGGDVHCCKQELLASAAEDEEARSPLLVRLRLKRNATWLCAFNSNKKFEPISFSGQ